MVVEPPSQSPPSTRQSGRSGGAAAPPEHTECCGRCWRAEKGLHHWGGRRRDRSCAHVRLLRHRRSSENAIDAAPASAQPSRGIEATWGPRHWLRCSRSGRGLRPSPRRLLQHSGRIPGVRGSLSRPIFDRARAAPAMFAGGALKERRRCPSLPRRRDARAAARRVADEVLIDHRPPNDVSDVVATRSLFVSGAGAGGSRELPMSKVSSPARAALERLLARDVSCSSTSYLRARSTACTARLPMQRVYGHAPCPWPHGYAHARARAPPPVRSHAGRRSSSVCGSHRRGARAAPDVRQNARAHAGLEPAQVVVRHAQVTADVSLVALHAQRHERDSDGDEKGHDARAGNSTRARANRPRRPARGPSAVHMHCAKRRGREFHRVVPWCLPSPPPGHAYKAPRRSTLG